MPSLQYSRIAHRAGPTPTVVVGACRSGTGTHAAIAYYSMSPVPAMRLLHLAWHRDLRDEEFAEHGGEYSWVSLGLEHAEEVALAAYCRLVSRNEERENITYALRYDDTVTFDPITGEVILPSGATGMSCSTFVAHLLRSFGIQLLDMSSWRMDRPGDRERQQQLVAWLSSHYDADYRAQAVRITPQIGCARVRPEDVVGACLFWTEERSANYADCEVGGRVILALLDHIPQS